jgi:hypothetical protein
MKSITRSALGLLLAAGVAASAHAQTSAQTAPGGSSLGDYAKQVRKDGSKPNKKVFDNDNLPREDKLSIVGPAPSSTGDSSADAKPADAAGPSADAKAPADDKAQASGSADKVAPKVSVKTAEEEYAARQAANKQWADKLAAQKDQIDMLTREVDVLQREYQVRAAAMYADAGNRMRNSADWDKQDATYKQQIADKQKALEEAKAKLEDSTEEARKAGVPSSVREP